MGEGQSLSRVKKKSLLYRMRLSPWWILMTLVRRRKTPSSRDYSSLGAISELLALDHICPSLLSKKQDKPS